MAIVKAAWRFIMGVKDLLVLLFLLLFFGALYAGLSMATGERPHSARSGALLLDLDGVIVEQPSETDPFRALLASEAPTGEYRLRDIVTALEAARTDGHVKAVVLNLDGFMGGGRVALARVGDALDALRKAGKPVLSFATIYEDGGYALAAHASEVWVNPIGAVAIQGPGGSQLYYKGLLDKFGVTAHIYRVGSYKSAVEPFMRADQSPEARAASQALAGAIWHNWLDNVRRARPAAKLDAYTRDPVAAAQAARGDLATAAQAAGLIDKQGDEHAFGARVAALAGADEQSETGYAAIELADYVKAKAPKNDGQIGVLTVAGEIVDGEARPGTAGGDSIAALLRQALAERDLKALVVRIDSPGGSVLASEKIRLAISEAKDAGLPVVASMGDVAASGGYWISTPASRVLAEPSTITGSIGVFGIVPGFRETLAKLGVTSDGIRTTPLSGEPDVLGGVGPEFNAIAQLSVEDMYRRFIGLVARARGLTPEKVDGIAQGRVWDGGTARQLHLVDRFGGLEDAIAEAAKLAKLDPARARAYYIEEEPDPFTRFVTGMLAARSRASQPRDLLARQAWRQQALATRALADAHMLAGSGGVRADCLDCAAYRTPVVAHVNEEDARWLAWLKMLLG